MDSPRAWLSNRAGLGGSVPVDAPVVGSAFVVIVLGGKGSARGGEEALGGRQGRGFPRGVLGGAPIGGGAREATRLRFVVGAPIVVGLCGFRGAPAFFLSPAVPALHEIVGNREAVGRGVAETHALSEGVATGKTRCRRFGTLVDKEIAGVGVSLAGRRVIVLGGGGV